MIVRPEVLLVLMLATQLPAAVLDLAPKRGQAVGSIKWLDETGHARQFSEFAGYPSILLPIYTRCGGACVQNVGRLKQALVNSSHDPRQFRVLLFSFDSADTPAALLKYRQRENIPLGWSVGTASETNIEALLESIGLQIGKAGTEFMHPNVLIFLDSNLRIAKWIYGTHYSNSDVDHALDVAAGRSDWIGRHSDVLYALLLFAATLLGVALFQQILQRHSVRVS